MDAQRKVLDPVEGLARKGISKIIYIKKDVDVPTLSDIWRHVKEIEGMIKKELNINVKETVFMDNEDIGQIYILYRFRYIVGDGKYIGCRVVTKKGSHVLTILTVGG